MLPIINVSGLLRPMGLATLKLTALFILQASVVCCTASQSTDDTDSQDDARGSNAAAQVKPPLRIAAAANLSHVMPKIIAAYEVSSPNQPSAIEVTYASSGKLYAQIKAGAPYDIFLSANQTFPAKLVSPYDKTQSLPATLSAQPFTYTQGQLALYSVSKPWDNAVALATQRQNLLQRQPQTLAQKQTRELDIAQVLLADSTSRVTIANPTLAPYGVSAKAYLQSAQLYAKLVHEKRLIQAENISQAFQYVYTGNVDYGFVALSQLVASDTATSQYRTLNINDYPAILQDGILLSKHPSAVNFVTYLQSHNAQKQFEQLGYLALSSDK